MFTKNSSRRQNQREMMFHQMKLSINTEQIYWDFGRLPLTGVIITHTDETEEWSKIWNVAISAKLPVTFLSGGQDIPGGFQAVIPEQLFDNWVSEAMR